APPRSTRSAGHGGLLGIPRGNVRGSSPERRLHHRNPRGAADLMATYPRPEVDPVAEASLATHVATKPAHGGDLAGTPRPPLSHVHIVDEVTGLQVALDEKAAAVELESLTLEVSA